MSSGTSKLQELKSQPSLLTKSTQVDQLPTKHSLKKESMTNTSTEEINSPTSKNLSHIIEDTEHLNPTPNFIIIHANYIDI
jgi:hypothetical protein